MKFCRNCVWMEITLRPNEIAVHCARKADFCVRLPSDTLVFKMCCGARTQCPWGPQDPSKEFMWLQDFHEKNKVCASILCLVNGQGWSFLEATWSVWCRSWLKAEAESRIRMPAIKLGLQKDVITVLTSTDFLGKILFSLQTCYLC